MLERVSKQKKDPSRRRLKKRMMIKDKVQVKKNRKKDAKKKKVMIDLTILGASLLMHSELTFFNPSIKRLFLKKFLHF